MAFEYVPSPPAFRHQLKQMFTDEFMQEMTNFKTFEGFQYSSAVFVNWKSDIMVYNAEILDNFVKESTKFSSWEEMICVAADRQFKKLAIE
jgi:hypothetical protein